MLAAGRLLMKDCNVTMEVFAQKPDDYVQDQRPLEEILNLTAHQALEAITKPLHGGVLSLSGNVGTMKEKDTITPLARGKPNGVLTQVLTEARREAEERLRGTQEMKFTISTNIEEVLFKGRVCVNEKKLNDFLTREPDGGGIVDTNRDVMLEEFFKDPTKYIHDAEVLGEIQATGAYARMEGAVREEMGLEEDLHKLHHEGVFSLEQWRDYEGKDTVTPLARRNLNSVLTQLLREESREAEERAMREEQVESTLTTTIRGVLFKGRVRVMEIKLNDFLTLRFGGKGIVATTRDVLLEEFLKDPTKYIRDKGALKEMQASGHYLGMKRAVKGEVIFDEDIRRLCDKGVNNLPGWSLAAAKVKAAVHNSTKHFLDAAAEEARNPTTTSAPEKLEGCYESVHNARWSHAVELPDCVERTKTGTGMGCMRGGQNSHGRTGKLTTLSKRMMLCSNSVRHLPC
ncbi:putative retrotransposon hot spot protein (RHS) [Trypanosoma cruzi]|uniref:Putative retrotransposon hot spot protein (RHS) n=1 Tax=Trypanosoma cruzi TaxID=5693 RepID=A0A2V2URE3_TRYCR|nr:putative retrotransposon hot spot protein (RHS) [Trypanosoma cruzi]RNC42165.1 retrotransposon hot spot (RHS) protein [Trypanosoma cruzi]